MTTATLLTDIEARLAAQVSGIQVVQAYDGIRLWAGTRKHRACTLVLPLQTDELEAYRTRDTHIWGEHTVTLQYGWILALAGADAITSRTDALGFADDIREAMVGPDAWSRSRFATFVDHELDKEEGLLVGTYTFRFRTPLSQ